MKNKKVSGFALGIIIIAIVLVLVIGGISYVVYRNISADSTAENTEVSITDSIIMEKLSKNRDYLSARHPSGGDFPIDKDLYQKQKINVTEVSETRKLHVALNSLYYEDDFSSIPPNQTILVNNYKDELDENRDIEKMITYSAVSDRYKDLFGKNLSSHPDILLSSEPTPCPAFIYDSSNKLYYSYPMCGGVGAADYAYNYQYSRNGNTFFVYASVGYGGDIVKTVYKGYGTNETLGESTDTFKGIDASNYNEFSKLKWTFSKNSNDEYHFVSVEKVN